MVSNTQQTERRRRRKKATSGKANKKARLKVGTPAFPLDPTKAAEAQK